MFTFNNICSRDMDLVVEELPPISTADGNYTEITVPGRDGQLLQSDGLKNIEKTVKVHFIGNHYDRLIRWLRGSGKVIFDNLPDRYYKAIIANKIPLEEILRNNLTYFPIIFTCKPCGYLREGDYPITLTKPAILNNVKCSYKSLPNIKINGTGECTFSINNRSFKITNIGDSIEINSELEYCNKGEYMVGDFPYLEEGDNNISWSGNVTSVEITPYWRSII